MQRHILLNRLDPDLKHTGIVSVNDERYLSDKIMGAVVTRHIFGADIVLLKPLISHPTTTNSGYRQTCHNFFRK